MVRRRHPLSRDLFVLLIAPFVFAGCSGSETSPGSGGAMGDGGTAGSGGSAGSGGAPSGGTGGSGGSTATGGAAGSAGSAGAAGAAGSPGSSMWGLTARVTPQTCLPPASRDAAPALLSQSGCVDPGDPTRPAAALIPYGITSPLWSDGAAKQRFIALPDDGTITVKNCAADPDACTEGTDTYTPLDDGDFSFPDGTVLVKTFGFGDRLVETRLLVRVDEFNWWGFSYEWRADQSDADLLPANETGFERSIETDTGTQTWHFPSRSQCLQCHTEATGRALGPEAAQLDADFTYPSGVVSHQLETLEHIGVIDPGAVPASIDPYPNPLDASAPLAARARSYLHANCANCHRPGGESSVTLDLRFGTPLGETGLCDAPEKGDLGVAGALRVAPGDPASSVLSLRMKTLDPEVRMPRIGTRVVDADAVAVIDAWIESLAACP
ncbi:MAG TPA: hypothetical protein VKZ49_11785 [Polyangiaceae bacterium]|nr:hypothetical protein [Polyangiaceae bacterium]